MSFSNYKHLKQSAWEKFKLKKDKVNIIKHHIFTNLMIYTGDLLLLTVKSMLCVARNMARMGKTMHTYTVLVGNISENGNLED
jgi:hypothetical protein